MGRLEAAMLYAGLHHLRCGQMLLAIGSRVDTVSRQETFERVQMTAATVDHRQSSDIQTERRISMHLRACVRMCSGGLLFSGTGDKSRVGSLGLSNSILVLPSNVALVLPPQDAQRAILCTLEI